jgi:hypothetical protein
MESGSSSYPRQPHFKSCDKVSDNTVLAVTDNFGFAERLRHMPKASGAVFMLRFFGSPDLRSASQAASHSVASKTCSESSKSEHRVGHSVRTSLSAVRLAAFVHRCSAAGFDNKRMAMSP